MANPNRTPTDEPSISVNISPVIEREFKRRDIFLELRIENAEHIRNGATGVHRITVDRANALIADAEAMQKAQNRELPLPRGIPAAYSALIRNIKCALKEEARRGLWDDPGLEEAKKRAAQSPARFDIGDKVLYFCDEDEEYGEKATVVEGYEMYQVGGSKCASYLSNDGRRIAYRLGYIVTLHRDGKEESFFVAAHKLTRDDCRPAHLCLVPSPPARAPART